MRRQGQRQRGRRRFTVRAIEQGNRVPPPCWRCLLQRTVRAAARAAAENEPRSSTARNSSILSLEKFIV
ncbi:hypothetical protein M8494_19220 [Serratia ureilytica]